MKLPKYAKKASKLRAKVGGLKTKGKAKPKKKK